MTEIETIVVRQGDYTASFAVDSDPAAIMAIAAEIGWHDAVPEAERATREELIAWMDKYFRAFPSGVGDVTSACRRLENGGGDFSSGARCARDLARYQWGVRMGLSRARLAGLRLVFPRLAPGARTAYGLVLGERGRQWKLLGLQVASC